MISRFLLGFSLLVAGCAYQMPQTITGRLLVEGKPMINGDVRLASGELDKTCSTNFLEAPVKAGAFSLERKVVVGRLAVEVQRDALCIRENNNWVLAWRNVYGPAPESLNFTCDEKQSEWKCTANNMEPSVK